MKRLYQRTIAALAGAFIVLVWGGLSHLVLFKGAGFRTTANEDRIVSTLRASLPGDGLYFLPNIDLKGNPAPAEQTAWQARFRAGPTGLIVFHAAGDDPVSARKLAVQALSALAAAGIVAYALSLAATTYWKRVGLAALLGALGLFTIATVYWNWYGFPNAFFGAQCVEMIVGWSLAGAVIAKLTPAVGSNIQSE